MSDQYDEILRTLKEGTIISLNSSATLPSTGELTVISSEDTKTKVRAKDYNDIIYKIYRNREDTLIYGKEEKTKTSYEDDVITIEIHGYNR